MLLVVWLLIMRPQQRRRQAQESMIEGLRIGDEVLTAGGIFGIVRRIEDDEVTVELSPGAEARVAKRAIAAVMPPEDDDWPATRADGGVTAEREPPDQARR